MAVMFVLQRFQPLIGQSCVGGVSVVEFITDRQLEFYTEREELQPFEVCAQGIIIMNHCVGVLFVYGRVCFVWYVNYITVRFNYKPPLVDGFIDLVDCLSRSVVSWLIC